MMKQALIDAAIELLKTRRVEELTVNDAARAIRVSSGAPYRHFEDRADFLAHIAAEGFERFRLNGEAVKAAHLPGSIDRLVAGGVAYVAFGAASPELFHLMWSAARASDKTEVAKISGENCYYGFIQDLTSTMQSHGLGHLDPQSFGAPLWAMVHGFAGLVIGENAMLDRDMDRIAERIDFATRAYFAGAADQSG